MSRSAGPTGPIGVGLLGMGGVGSGVASILIGRAAEYARTVGRPLAIRRILVRDADKPRDTRVDRQLITTNPDDLFDDEGIHVIIEVIGGEEPAHTFLRRALDSGRYVITA